MALHATAALQIDLMEATMANVKQFLDYCTTHNNAVITYRVRDMLLAVHSDAEYLIEKNAHSQAGGHFTYWMIFNSPKQ